MNEPSGNAVKGATVKKTRDDGNDSANAARLQQQKDAFKATVAQIPQTTSELTPVVNDTPKKSGFGFSFVQLFCRCFQDRRDLKDPTIPMPVIRPMQENKPVIETPTTAPATPQQIGRKTLVLDLDETLVHASFEPIDDPNLTVNLNLAGTTATIYVRYRPGAKEFLVEMAKTFELIVFTASLSEYANPVIDDLDPTRVVTGRLYRENCTFHRGFYVKDLSRMNRPLKDLILVDNSEYSFMFQPQNGFLIKAFYDDENDTELFDLIHFFNRMTKEVDVRPVHKFKETWDQDVDKFALEKPARPVVDMKLIKTEQAANEGRRDKTRSPTYLNSPKISKLIGLRTMEELPRPEDFHTAKEVLVREPVYCVTNPEFEEKKQDRSTVDPIVITALPPPSPAIGSPKGETDSLLTKEYTPLGGGGRNLKIQIQA